MVNIIWMGVSIGDQMKRQILRTCLFLVGLSLFVYQTAHAFLQGVGPITKKTRVQRFHVDPDITVFLVTDRQVPIVNVNVLFPYGTDSPWVQKNRIDEAFLIQSTDTNAILETKASQLGTSIKLKLENVYGQLEISVLKQDVPQAIDLLHQVLENRDFDSRTLMEKKFLAGPALSNYKHHPLAYLAKMIEMTLYSEQDIRRLGNDKHLIPTTKASFLANMRDKYIRIPGRVIAFSGDITKAEAEAMVHRLKLPLPDTVIKEGLIPTYLPLRMDARDFAIGLPGITQSFFAYVRPGLAVQDPDYPALKLASYIFAEKTLQSRLFQALREDEGDSYTPSLYHDSGVIPGCYVFYVSTRANNTANMEQKLRDTLSIFYFSGVTQEEWKDARDFFRGARAFNDQTALQILSRSVGEHFQKLNIGFFDALDDKIETVSLEELNRFIRKFYDPRHFTMLKVVPK